MVQEYRQDIYPPKTAPHFPTFNIDHDHDHDHDATNDEDAARRPPPRLEAEMNQ